MTVDSRPLHVLHAIEESEKRQRIENRRRDIRDQPAAEKLRQSCKGSACHTNEGGRTALSEESLNAKGNRIVHIPRTILPTMAFVGSVIGLIIIYFECRCREDYGEIPTQWATPRKARKKADPGTFTFTHEV